VDLIRLPFFAAEKGEGVSPAIGEATILALVRACVAFTRPTALPTNKNAVSAVRLMRAILGSDVILDAAASIVFVGAGVD
jgi:hypothetical protein